MVFHWSLSDCKSPQVSRTLLSILADLNNAVVCIVSTRPLISKSSSPLLTVLSEPITIGITFTFMFHSFELSCKVLVLISLFTFLQFYSVVSWNGKVHFSAGSLLFVDYHKIWLLGRNLYFKILENFVSHFLGWILGYAYTICSYGQILNLHNSLWINFLTQSCVVLYSLCTNLLHSFIM